MIKLCGIRTVEDALLCANAGADELGVIFAEKSKRRVSIEVARRIRDAVKLPLVGVFVDADLDEVERIAALVGLQAAQLHGRWSAPRALPLYAALQITGPASIEARPGAARLLLDGPAGGSGKSFAWSLAREVSRGALVYIAGGLTPENVAMAVREARPDGVDVASGIENESGFKDGDKVRAFVRAAREALCS